MLLSIRVPHIRCCEICGHSDDRVSLRPALYVINKDHEIQATDLVGIILLQDYDNCEAYTQWGVLAIAIVTGTRLFAQSWQDFFAETAFPARALFESGLLIGFRDLSFVMAFVEDEPV
jgi:hypothetical protein